MNREKIADTAFYIFGALAVLSVIDAAFHHGEYTASAYKTLFGIDINLLPNETREAAMIDVGIFSALMGLSALYRGK